MSLSFKNRIAFYYIFTSAILIFVVFFAIFNMVKMSVFSHLEKDLFFEGKKHLSEIEIRNNIFQLIDKEEWNEREHTTLSVNPVFVQFLDHNFNVIEKSPNLKLHILKYENQKDNLVFDTKLNNVRVKQIQVPILSNKNRIGYILIAMPSEDAVMVIENLFSTMIVSYPLILLTLFVIARFIAGRSIKPINSIISTSNVITKDNLTARIDLPINKDELYNVSQTINKLLDRIENAVEREKQFTSYASHELRTPISIIKGTLEVLIRKPRNQDEYQEKINYCINEVNRINSIIDQLLLLARFENQKKSLHISNFLLDTVVTDILVRFQSKIETKHITINKSYPINFEIKSDIHLFSIVINNLISNALKYSKTNGSVFIEIEDFKENTLLKIRDKGIGIEKSEVNKIFDSFYRSNSLIEQNDIKGSGLGLAIVNRLCDILSIEISVESELNCGTSIILSISK